MCDFRFSTVEIEFDRLKELEAVEKAHLGFVERLNVTLEASRASQGVQISEIMGEMEENLQKLRERMFEISREAQKALQRGLKRIGTSSDQDSSS